MSRLCLKLPGRKRHRSTWSPISQRPPSQPSQANRRYVVRQENMPVGMEVTEDTPPDMLTGSMNLKLVLPSGKKIKTSIDRSTPMMDLLVHITTCHKLSPAAHVLQPYGERGVLPYKPSTPIGALDTVMVHVVPKNQLTQNQSNKMALKQVSQPFEQTHRIQVSLPRNQLYVLRANGRTTIADIHSEICNEKNLDPSKYSLRHPKEMNVELKGETTIAEYKMNQLILVSNRANPANQLSTDDIINAIQNINNNNNNNIYAFEPSSRSLSPDSSVSPVAEPPKPLRKKKPPAPKPPQNNINQKSSKEKSLTQVESSTGRVICHSRTSSDSSGYHEASLLSESPPSNNSSLPDSLPRRSKLESKHKSTSRDGLGVNVQQNQALSKSLVDLKAHHTETSSSMSSVQQQSSLKSAQSTTSLHTGRKKRLAPPPPPSTLPPMRPVIEEKLNGNSENGSAMNSETDSIDLETPAERSRTLEPERKTSQGSIEKSQTLPPGLDVSVVTDSESVAPLQRSQSNRDVTSVAVSPPDERDLVMEDEEIDRIFNNATADHNSLVASTLGIAEAHDSGRDSSGSNEVHKSFGRVGSPHKVQKDSPDGVKPVPNILPSPVKTTSDEPLMDWEYKLPAPPTFRDPPESPKTPDVSSPVGSDLNELTPRSAVMSELSSLISQRSTSTTKITEDILNPVNDIEIENNSTLDNFKISAYAPAKSANVTVRRNNSLVRESNSALQSEEKDNQNPNASVKRSVSHVSLFVRPYDNPRSKTLDRTQDNPVSSSTVLRKTTSEFNIDTVGRKERPQSCVEPQGLQSLQVLRSILPQLSQSQGNLNTITETEPIKTSDPVVVIKPRPRFEREEKVAVSLGTWGERPKRQVSIKSDKDYVFGQGGAIGFKKTPPLENQMRQDSNLSNLQTSVTNIVKLSQKNVERERSKIAEEDKVESSENGSEIYTSDDERKPKRISNVYKNLDTGNTKPLRQILGDVSRVPVVRSVELKAPYKQEWQLNQNRGLDRLKERFESENQTKETSVSKETEKFESTGKIRERFETAIKERYETTGKFYNRRDQDNTPVNREPTKININQDNAEKPSAKYGSKVKIDGNQTIVSSTNKMISETKIELNESNNNKSLPLTNRYTSVIGIGGSDSEVVRVRVKTSTGRSVVAPQPTPLDPRQQLLTSIRGFGGLESLKKVRS